MIALVAAATPASAETAPATSDPTAPTTSTTPTAAPSTPTATATTPAATATTPAPPTTRPSSQRPRVLVFGDSISSRGMYSAVAGGPKPRAWWSWVAQSAGIDPRTFVISAESGSGIVRTGRRANTGRQCSGTTFGQRLGMVAQTRPDVIVVEVGRNDTLTCRKGRAVRASVGLRMRTARTYFDNLARAADSHGIARSKVYVLTPWGSKDPEGHGAVASLYEAQVTARGFTWITLPSLIARRTLDGTHPSAAGSRQLASWVASASDLVAAVAGRSASTPPGANVLCTGYRTSCSKAFRSYRNVRGSIWGSPAETTQHYVAYRLSRAHRRSSPVLGTRTPRDWLDVAQRLPRTTVTGLPRKGAVAWWRFAPAGTGNATGHIAVVEAVAKDHSWIKVSEVTANGSFRVVRYRGASLPTAYLNFRRTNGSPRGTVTSVVARRTQVTVTGRAADADAVERGVRIKVIVSQGGRSWAMTLPAATRYRFAETVAVGPLHRGRVTVRVVALNAPRSRGTDTVLATRHLRVR